MKRQLLVISSILALSAASANHPAFAFEQPDYLGMAQMYGRNVQETLHTEIMNDAGRNAMRQSQRARGQSGSSPGIWPSHISEASVADHEFTVAELAAMNSSDPARASQMLAGRTITVVGQAQAHRRDSGQSFHVVDAAGGGYNVHVRSGMPADVRDGDAIRVRGQAGLERRSFMTLSSPQVLAGSAPRVNTSPVAGDHGTAQDTSLPPDYAALRFSASPGAASVARKRLVETLTPALTGGNTPQDLQRMFDSGELQRGFASGLESYGFSMNDLADIYAGVLMLSWQVANDQRELSMSQRQGMASVRDGLREAFARAWWLPQLGNDEKQILGETLVLGSTVIASRFQHGVQSGDAASINHAQADARTLVKAIAGFDPASVQLTAAGFK